MDSTSILLLIFIVATIIHFWFVVKPSWKSIFATKYTIENYSNRSNNISIFLSVLIFFFPIILFNHYRSLTYTNNLSDIIFLISISAITIFLIFLNRKVFWSEKFREPSISIKQSTEEIEKLEKNLKSKFLQNESITSNLKKNIEEKFLVCATKISKNRDDINFLQDKSSNTDFLLNESSKALNFKIDNTKESIKNITKNLNKIGDAEKKKLKAKVELENKCFKDYFQTEETFEKFEKLLHNNDFYLHKNNLTATNLCILTCKLLDLKALSINKKQEYYCIAIAKYFNVPEFDKSNLSRAKKNNENGSFSIAHKELFHALKYLDKLNKR